MDEHHSCSGCGLCLLVCPVWRQTGDQRLTPKGRAKAIQHGAMKEELAASASTCLLCGACEPVCPEKLPLIGMVMELRGNVLPEVRVSRQGTTRPVFLAGSLDEERKRKVLAALGKDFSLATDDGSDIALALESGDTIAAERLERFLTPLRTSRRVVAVDGLLARALRRWLPGAAVSGLGEALMPLAEAKLRAGDLYVIESRAYNGEQERLVGRYDALRRATGCETNLDLMRIAVPAMASEAQARWILEGRRVERIVVEDLADRAAFAFAGKPVLHLADLA